MKQRRIARCSISIRWWACATRPRFPRATGCPARSRWSRFGPTQDRYAELLDVVQLYHATVVEDSADAIIIELTGSEAFVLSCIRAIERFEIVEIARSGTVAMETVHWRTDSTQSETFSHHDQ